MKRIVLHFFLIVLVTQSVIGQRERDSMALAALYHATNGDNWINNDNWLSDKPLNEWYGIEGGSEVVTLIRLVNNNLVGAIPPEIGNLSSLVHLELSNNQITSIPAEFGNLSKLGWILLDNNQLLSLPAEIGNLLSLEFLAVNNNQIRSIPPEIGSLSKLFCLVVANNRIQSLPSEMVNLTSLMELVLDGNQFTEIPPVLGDLELNCWYLRDNEITTLRPLFENLEKIERSILLTNNRLTANDFFFDIENLPTQNFEYQVQKTGIEKDTFRSAGFDYNISFDYEGNGQDYQWYKNGIKISGQVGETLNFESLSYSDSGSYHCEFRDISDNHSVELYVHTQPVHLKVMEPENLPFSIHSNNMCAGNNLSFTLNTLSEFIDYTQENHFIIQLSDQEHNFDQAISLGDFGNASVIESSVSIPDTLSYGKTYYVSLKSTAPEYHGEKVYAFTYRESPQFSLDAPESICFNSTALITYNGDQSGDAIFTWDFDGGIVVNEEEVEQYEVSWDNGGEKAVSLRIEDSGCFKDSTLIIKVSPQPTPISICMVSVNESNSNMVVWETTKNNLYDSIYIYRETSQLGIYEKIGAKSGQEEGIFVDEKSNPAQQSSRYKLSVLDSCGFVSDLSAFHQTLHLMINAGMNDTYNLIWSGYKGFDFSTFNIYRGTVEGELYKIAEVPGNIFNYSDLNPPANIAFYQVEVINPEPCIITTKKSATNYVSSRSNVVSSRYVSREDVNIEHLVHIYPNPVSEKLFIKVNKEISAVGYFLKIINESGETITVEYSNDLIYELDVTNLSGEGLYFLQLLDKNGKIRDTRKFIFGR